MATSSISGLASGLDSATIIDQLMQLEAMSQRRLKVQQNTHNSVLTALRQVNTRASTLGSTAAALAKPENWQSLKATSSNPLVSVASTASASPTTFSLTVKNTAVAHQLGYANAGKLTTDVVNGTDNSVTLTVGGVAQTPIATDGTLADVAKQINAAKQGVTATLVRTGESDGSADYKLLLTADKTGAAAQFTVAGLDSTVLGAEGSVAGKDAVVDLGLGITASSATNTFTDLAPGVTVTLAAGAVGDADPAKATTSTITVAQDPTVVAGKVKDLVTQVNDLLGHLDTQTNAGATGTRGVLAGDAATRSLRSALANTVFGSDNTSMAELGIQTDRYGKVVFDEAKFKDAYANDPAGVAARFTTSATEGTQGGWAARVDAVTEAAYGDKGSITGAIAGRESTIKRLDSDIEAWDLRLEKRRANLERTYTALETALSKLNSQGNWLAGQINSLPSYND